MHVNDTSGIALQFELPINQRIEGYWSDDELELYNCERMELDPEEELFF